MISDQVTEIMRQTLYIAIEIGFPFLLIALVTGLLVAFFQSVTRIQEMTLVFVPKILVVAFSIAVLFPWILKIMTKFTHSILISSWDNMLESITYVL